MANQVPNSRWFQGAEDVSRACFTGLGADGCGSWATFFLGTYFSAGLGKEQGVFYRWRSEVGQAIMQSGYDYFKKSFNNPNSYSVQDDIAQLLSEQKMVQSIHEKYLKDENFFREVGQFFTDVNLLSYEDRVRYGCKTMGLTPAQGCKP